MPPSLRIRFAPLLLCFCLCLPVHAMAGTTSGDTDAHLLEIDAQWNTLRQSADTDALDALLVDDWLLTHSDGRTQDKAAYLDELRTRTRRNTGIANQDVQVRRYGDSFVVTGASVQSAISNGVAWSGRFRFTRVWVRHGAGWKMVASHSSRITDPS